MTQKPSDVPVLKPRLLRLLFGLSVLITLLLLFDSVRNYRELLHQTSQAAEITQSYLNLQQDIGYGGFIHSFKNALLRPDESRYLVDARQSLTRLAGSLEQTAVYISNSGDNIDLERFRSTFKQYENGLSILENRPGHLSVEAVDQLVLVDDSEALKDLSSALRVVLDAANESSELVRQTLRTDLVFLFLAIIATLFTATLALLERTRQALRQELVADSLSRRSLEIEQSNSELRSFAYAVSHDLKGPSNSARLLLEELHTYHAEQLDADGQELLRHARRSVQRLIHIVEELLRYTRVVGQEMLFERVDMNTLTADVIDSLKADIEQAGASIDTGVLPEMDANPTQMRSLMQNLIANALKFRRHDVPCRISVEQLPTTEPGYVSLCVRDNGIGIAEHSRDQIFDMFHRQHRADQAEGIGLGLALCKRVAINHGGSISVLSNPAGPGSVFTVTLLQHHNR